ncbi:MAG: hypothetical protein KDD62_05480 [Bdellovibrionales bacterium]|nr:hypothetical protein [Bdellovibrionales bacterium]
MDLFKGADEGEGQWRKSYCVFRTVENGALMPVFLADSLKDAKYWITYIAEPGDALFRTPLHPKNSGDQPLYWQHKGEKGDLVEKQDQWEQMVQSKKCSLSFMFPPEDL